MAELADGNFKSPLDLKEDESEVGSMVASINFMKQKLLAWSGKYQIPLNR